MPIKWYSKRQKTVELLAYGLELLAARIATKLKMKLKYTLRMLGVLVDEPALMLGDKCFCCPQHHISIKCAQ